MTLLDPCSDTKVVDVFSVHIRGQRISHTTEFAEVVRLVVAAGGASTLHATEPNKWEALGGLIQVTKHLDMKEDEWLD